MTLFSTFYFELQRSSTANFFGTVSSVTVTVLKTGLICLVFVRYPGQNCESIDSDVSKLKVNIHYEFNMLSLFPFVKVSPCYIKIFIFKFNFCF